MSVEKTEGREGSRLESSVVGVCFGWDDKGEPTACEDRVLEGARRAPMMSVQLRGAPGI